MRIRMLAVGTRRPRWEEEGFHQYARRLGAGWTLELREIAVARRSRSVPVERARAREGERLLAGVPRGARIIALDVRGQSWSSEELARRFGGWLGDGRDVALLIGGPDGLAPECLASAEQRWSLSALTLPHGLARIVVAEQIYRAWSLLNRHPYHRA